RRTGTERPRRRCPGGRASRPLRKGPARPSPAGVRAPRAATARPWPCARSPRARGTPAARAAARGPRGARRRARGSLRDELEAVGHVADLPAGRLDPGPKLVGCGEVPLRPRRLAPFGERDELGRCALVLGERGKPEEIEPASQQLVVAPPVEGGERGRCVEV